MSLNVRCTLYGKSVFFENQVFKLGNRGERYQTLGSMNVVDAQAFNMPSCSRACLATAEESVGVRILCRMGASGFEQQATLRHNALRIIHKPDIFARNKPTCHSKELIVLQTEISLDFYDL